MARFEAAEPNGVAVQQVEVLVRAAIYKPANALVGFLLQGAADRIDASYTSRGHRLSFFELLEIQGKQRLKIIGVALMDRA